MKAKSIYTGLSALLVVGLCLPIRAQEEGDLEIHAYVEGKEIPIHLEGFPDEVEKVLAFDLFIVGFKTVDVQNARYVLSGNQASRVEGRLRDRLQNKELLAKAYSGGTLRSQAHALADDVVFAVTGVKGIASTSVAFRVRTRSGSEIYIADYDGFNARPVTNDGSIVRAPTWFPGRPVLYYTSYMKDNPDIYRHDLKTGSRQAVARFLGTNNGANISPDGTKLAMTLGRSGLGPDLYVGDVDGTNLKRLTRTKEDESAPCWSPDGKTICFVSRVGSRPKLYTISAEGGEMQRLTASGVLNATEPDWSPDGKTIAFTTLRGGRFELCLVDARGGVVEDLRIPGEDPSWAPNSRTLMFTKRRPDGERTLSLLDVETKHVKDVLHTARGSYSQPAWGR